MSEKKLYGRAQMLIAPGRSSPLGYWPENLDGSGWAQQGKNIYRQALQICQRYHENAHAQEMATAAKQPPPDLGDPVTRHQLAKADLKKLEGLVGKMAAIDKEVTAKQSALRAFDYAPDLRETMLRGEMRTHLRGLDDDKRRQALRDPKWRAAALETAPELSGLSPTYAKALEDETLREKYPDALAGINEGRQAVEALQTVMQTLESAIEHELRITAGTVAGPAPQASKPWIDD